MSNAVITNAGLNLFARAHHEGFSIPVDRMLFADIPGLNTDLAPDPESVRPAPETIVFDAEISNSGRVDNNRVIYSYILPATVGPFYINWIGLYSTQYGTLIAAYHVPRHLKTKTDGFRIGNTFYKNFALEFLNAAQLTGITVPPQSWQYNYDDRYAMKAHEHPEIMEAINRIDHIGYTRMGDTNIELPEGIVGGIEYDEV